MKNGGEELKISMVGDWKIQGGKGKGEWVKGKRKWRGRGSGRGIITLRGNEKWETKNSKYQWWGIGR